MSEKRPPAAKTSSSQSSTSSPSPSGSAPKSGQPFLARILETFLKFPRPLAWLSRSWLLSLGIGAVIGAVVLATLDLRYYARVPFWERTSVTPVLQPWEWNPNRELPVFSNVILSTTAIVPVKGQSLGRFYVGGSGALLAFSDDGGLSWTRLVYDSIADCFHVPGQTCPGLAAGAVSSGSNLPNILAIRLKGDGQGALVTSDPFFFVTKDLGQTWSRIGSLPASIFVPAGKCPQISGHSYLTELLFTSSAKPVPFSDLTSPIPPYTFGCFTSQRPQLNAVSQPDLFTLHIRTFNQFLALTSDFSLRPPDGSLLSIESLWFTPAVGWAAGQAYPFSGQLPATNQGLLLERPSSASDWTPHKQPFPMALRSVTFDTEGKVGLLSGDNGALFATGDSGQTWVPITYGAAQTYGAPPSWFARHSWVPAGLAKIVLWPLLRAWRLPPWWFFVLLSFGLISITAGLLPPPPPPPPPGFNSSGVGDVPVTRPDGDRLNFAPIIRGLSGLIRNRDTALPLTVGINGSWGSGKTSLMNLVRADLWDAGLRTVWFNAWHHQEEPNLLAALLQTIRNEAPPDILEPGGCFYRAKLFWQRVVRRPWHTLLIFVLAVGILAAHYHVRAAHQRFYLDAAIQLRCAVEPLHTPSAASSPGSPAPSPAKDRPLLEQIAEIFIRLAGGKEFNPVLACGSGPNPETTNTELPKDSSAPGVFVFLVLLLLLWPKLNELFKSFGANPAELLITRSSGSKISELESQTNFREKFKKQYGDVTHALAPRRLVIFIDDLDRCRPDKIGEMLEAVNYVVVAGPCVVVLGMEEEAVRAGLGLSFRDLAKELSLPPVPSPTLTPRAAPSENPNRDARQSFAARYMKKLLNVVIQVPVLTEDQYFDLISAEPRAPQAPQEIRDQKLSTYGHRARFGLIALAAFTLSIVLGFLTAEFFGSYISPANSPQEAAQSAVLASASGSASTPPTGTPSSIQTGTTNTNAAQNAQQSAPPVNPIAPPGPAGFSAAASALPGAWFSGVPGFTAAAILALLLGLGIARLFESKPFTTTDSPDLKSAFQIWSKVMAEITNTPREAKRLLNRIRYLALVDDPLPPDIPLWRRLFPSGAPQPQTGEQHIPSQVLVALTVDQAAHLAISQATEERKESLQKRLAAAWADHRKAYPGDKDGQDEDFRDRFARIVQGVATR